MLPGIMAGVASSISWERAHEGNEGTWWAFTPSRCMAGQVAHYDRCGGTGRPGWVGYSVTGRVTGRCDTAEMAMLLVTERIGAT